MRQNEQVKRWTPRASTKVLAAFLGVFALLSVAEKALLAQPPTTGPVQPGPVLCYRAMPCVDPKPGCVPVPTSVPAVSSIPDREGWEPAPGSAGCGIRRKWVFFWEVCGPPLAGAACGVES